MMVRLTPPALYLGVWFILIVGLVQVHADYPGKPPYMDKCVGKSRVKCTSLKSSCVWDTSGAPDCFERNYFVQRPGYKDPLDIVIRFFEFSFGVHLAEGNNQQTHVVSSVTECAKLCLSSTGRSGIPCLSFDYYPHENPIASAPFYETPYSGFCVLNSASKDQSRLRNVDMGMTDAELFYTSHFTHRPFSGEEGYYELRDSRGGQIATLLEYTKGVRFNAVTLWPRSRWGIMYLSTPIEVATSYICADPDDEGETPVIDPAQGSSVEFSEDASVRFTGAFTPVDYDQHCVGLATKPQAMAICADAGGYLCTKAELALSRKVKLGCNLDKYPIWSAESAPKDITTAKQFVRCCTKFSVLNICPFFSKSQMDFCGKFTSETACIDKGSGKARQEKQGFGNLRQAYIDGCRKGTMPCTGMIKNWSTRDSCIWCLMPGENPNGVGECRAGNDYGVCANAPENMQRLFALKIEAQCNSKVVCRIAQRYPEKGLLFDAITPSPTTGSPTPPTESPTTANPLTSPTRSPTTEAPSKNPTTRKPTTGRPSRSPTTKAPTTARPTKPTTRSPTKATLKPSLSPSHQSPTNSPSTTRPSRNPTTKPSHVPSNSPSKKATHGPSKVPSKSPTRRPSIGPTNMPSASPSSDPTAQPSTSPQPE